jgi:hypothetical protein
MINEIKIFFQEVKTEILQNFRRDISTILYLRYMFLLILVFILCVYIIEKIK